ncbi:MAG: heavy metal-binding domain-containing protein [Patescibacteria group bacterium]
MIQQYTCPMHPEVVSDQPGTCPKCGMALVEMSVVKVAQPAQPGGAWSRYQPLAVVVLMITAVTAVSSAADFELQSALMTFMIGFFLVFGSFKLMDLKGFVEGYATYDLLAAKFKGYGYVYPFIEIAFGLLMLGGYHPDWLLGVEFGVMAFSGLGVSIKLAKGEKFTCACLGTFLKVPLTYVTLVEDFGMAIMALLLILAF